MTKRYELDTMSDDFHTPHMDEDPNGEFVHYSDYELAVDGLKQTLQELEEGHTAPAKLTIKNVLFVLGEL